MSGIVNKIKEAMHSDSKSTTHTGTHTTGTHNTHSGAAEGVHGPHSSRVANAADPRVDSDRDGSNTVGRTAGHGEMGSSNPFSSTGTTGHSNPLGSSGTHNNFGSSGTGGVLGSAGTPNTHSGTAEGVHGPHSSRLANAADPRVDSDRDGSNTLGNNSGYNAGGMTGGLSSSTHNTHGTHAGSGMTGMTGTHGDPAGTHGPHSSRMANAADPRVDSDRDGRGAIGTGPGPAANTAGPHKSDMLNKVDPRVDSDMDGSKTMGPNKTYQSSTGAGVGHVGHRDPTDAAQVPPSVLRQHIGDPLVEHDDHTHQRERRNSVRTDQETFRGL